MTEPTKTTHEPIVLDRLDLKDNEYNTVVRGGY